jgi:hypothetical protein
MMSINAFYEAISERIRDELQQAPEPGSAVEHWIVVQSASGVDLLPADIGENRAISSLLSAQLEQGASGAAFVAHVPAPREHLIADALVFEPRNSDIRRADVSRSASGVELRPWEPMV